MTEHISLGRSNKTLTRIYWNLSMAVLMLLTGNKCGKWQKYQKIIVYPNEHETDKELWSLIYVAIGVFEIHEHLNRSIL